MLIKNTKEILKIPFAKIKINPANPRHINMLDELSAAMWLIDEDLQQMGKLIESFIENGFLPIPFAVIRSTNGEYIALDGNRRLTALKLLVGSISLPDTRKYYQLSDLINKNKLENTNFELDCLIYENEEEASSYIVSIHQSGGTIPGQKKWTPLQQNRYADMHSKKIDDWYIFAKKYLKIDEMEKLSQPTTLSRIINNKKFRQLFRFDEKYNCSLDEELKQKVVQKIISDLNNEVINSRKLNCSENVEKYLLELAKAFNLKSETDGTAVAPSQIQISGLPPKNNLQQTSGFSSNLLPNNPIRIQTTPNRKTVIPNHINLTCSNTKITYLNNDLKQLDVGKYKATCAIALRVLIELLTKYYMQKNLMRSDRDLEKESSLHSDISAVLNDMRNKKLMADALHQQCINYVNKDGRVRFLNGCIHHLDVNPDTENLVEMFDTLEKYLEICSQQ